MRKVAIYILFILFVVPCLGQDSGEMERQPDDDFAPPDQIFYFDPLSIFFGTFKVGYEHKLRQGKNGLMIKPHLRYMNMFGNKQKGGGAELQYRIYLNKLRPEPEKDSDGLLDLGTFNGYFAPYARYKYREYENGIGQANGNTSVYNIYEGGIAIGIKSEFAKYFMMDFYFGGGFRYSTNDDNAIIFFGPGYSGVIPRLGVTVGVPL